MRLHLVDGIRGHLLIGMLIAHLSFMSGMSALGQFHHVRIIGMYDAEFFVPISGFIIGYLFIDRIKTIKNFYNFLISRLKTIYKYYLLSALPFLLLKFLYVDYSFKELCYVVGNVIVMQDGGSYSDILPIYFYCFLLLALLFWTIPKLGFGFPILFSAGIYCLSQVEYSTGMFGLSERFVIFDIAAWQFLFVIFVFAGTRFNQAVDIITKIPPRTYLALVAALTFLSAAGSLIQIYPTPFSGYQDLASNWPRMQLHPIFLTKIMLVVSLFSLIIMRSDNVVYWPNRIFRFYLTLPILQNVGKYSIQMFTLHVYLIALFKELEPILSLQEKYMLAISLIAIFIALPNIWVVLKQRKGKAMTSVS